VNFLDMRTVIISYIITSAICALVMFFLWTQDRRRFEGLGFWLVAYLTQFAGLVLIIMRDYLPDFVSAVVGNGIFIGGVILLYIGLEHFLGKRSNQFHNYIILALFVAAHAYFLVVRPNMTARSVNLSLALLALCAQFVWLTFRRANVKLRPIVREVGFVFAAYGAVSLIRICVNLAMPLDEDFFQLDLFDTIVVMTYQMLFIALTFSLFLAVNRRLTGELERDIELRKQAEQVLKESEQQYRQMFIEHSAVKLLIDPATGSIVQANPAASRFYGYPLEILWAMNIRQIDTLPHEAIFAAMQHALRRARSHFISQNCLASGEVRDVEVYSAPIEVGGRQLLYSIIHDITERKAAEKKLQQAQAQIVEQQSAMAAFNERERLARELHDGIGQTFGYIGFQTQLARDLVVMGNAEDASQAMARLTEVAQEAHEDLRGYIRGLKSPTPVARQEFFDALRQYCRHLEQAYFFRVDLKLPAVLPAVVASTQVETHLIYIIREALGNARRHSGQAQAAVTIELEDEYVQAVIQDDGAGMAGEYTGPERRKTGRLGMGIMHERVKDVGGTLVIETVPGRGTRVTARLPRKLSGDGLAPVRILIVDDHPLFVEGLGNMLSLRGVQVVGVARNGIEAQDAARSLKPGIILMDINMPRMNGLEATRLIKADMPDVKIVMLTTSAEEEDLYQALHAGASGYLLKGMNADEFMTMLGEISRGEAEFSADMAKKILAEFLVTQVGEPQKATFDSVTLPIGLTERQVEILRLVSQGLLYKEVGERLFLTERTVKYHMGEILSRLQLKGRREAMEYGKRKGLA
jgi:PAS domain S-box-containing protein